MPAARSPAQIEASRRDGARSKGPTTAKGKARSSRNALTHGLCALHHLVLEEEVPDDLDELIGRITAETGAVGEVGGRLARRLAIAFWKGKRAEKIEIALFDAAPRTRMDGFRQEDADPLTTFDHKRFNAIRSYQAQHGREISRCLKELLLLRKEALAACTDEPGPANENEPKQPPAANVDATAPDATARPALQNEPDRPADPAPPEVWTVDGVPLLDAWGRPRRYPLAVTREPAESGGVAPPFAPAAS